MKLLRLSLAMLLCLSLLPGTVMAQDDYEDAETEMHDESEEAQEVAPVKEEVKKPQPRAAAAKKPQKPPQKVAKKKKHHQKKVN